MIKNKHPITDELLDQLLTNYQKLEDLIGCALPVYAGREAAVGQKKSLPDANSGRALARPELAKRTA